MSRLAKYFQLLEFMTMSVLSKETVTAHDLSFKLLLSEEEIQERVAAIGAEISLKYKDKRPIFLGVLNGAFIFTADLVRACGIDCETSFIKLSSYSGTASTGKVSTHIGLQEDLKDRHVIVVEDIIDTGETLHQFLPELEKMQPASVALVACLVKREAMRHDLPIAYSCFDIPNKFVIGYGLDYDGLARNYPSIYQLIEK